MSDKCRACGSKVSSITGGDPRTIIYSCKSKMTDGNFTESHKCAHRRIAHLRQRVEDQILEIHGLLLEASTIDAQLEQTRRERDEANGLLDEIASLESDGSDGEALAMTLGEIDHILAKRKGK